MGVLIPSPVPHLDRVFDYSVPANLRDRAVFGVRVRVRFAGRLRTGFVVTERTTSEFDLRPVVGVLGPPVLTPAQAALTEVIASRYVGNWGDVLSAAVPPRHARAERSVCDDAGRLPDPVPVRAVALSPGALAAPTWPAWDAACRVLGAGSDSGSDSGSDEGPLPFGAVLRAAMTVPWGWEVAPVVARAVAEVLGAGRRVLIVVPDDDDVRQVRAALELVEPKPTSVVLTAGAGPQARYGAYLRALSGQAEVVIGTRSAAFAPVPELGLIVLWRDADPSMPDPQAPYWHPREVTGLRSATELVPWIAAGRSRSTEVQRLVEVGWAGEATPPREAWRAAGPPVRAVGEADLARDGAAFAARLPKAAFEVARTGLTAGPVLVQVARRGYVPAVACAQCRELATCAECQGPLRLPARGGSPTCGRCGAVVQAWQCPTCGGHRLRAVRVGSARTAEELARAFSGVAVLASDAEVGVRQEVPDVPSLIVATPGAEPHVAGGRYRAALLLDGEVMAGAPRLRAAEDAVARWSDAASLVAGDGVVMLAAGAHAAPVQAMVRADPVGWASRELAERVAAGLPPAVRMIALEGPDTAVAELLGQTAHELGVESMDALGPVPVGEIQRWLLRVDYAAGQRLTAALSQVQRERSLQRRPVVTVRVDPPDID
ncbi:MAG: hypothetical protein QG597_2450 [Actinomycetota bacterium]|nr:hypothetical protein [Actinomycetota bacterium]